LSFTSAADFQTAEYQAQWGLAAVRADRLYYNGHYDWYMGLAPDPAAGTGIGVKIAVADTGINAPEARSGGAIAIDTASYDYIRDRRASGADEYGHGTHVAGIIAAPKNGAGMHGLAYNATVVNFKVADANGVVRASDAQLADMMQRAAAAGAMIINNSWGTRQPITSYSAEELQAQMPRMIEASRAYVGKGGVLVFAAGNEYGAPVSLQAGLPYRIGGIQPGWLAVVAVDAAGAIADYSNRCGVAAAWCLAAPGGSNALGVLSMQNTGEYEALFGTSMAAPHAAAALGALKSRFPNLSYLQIRDRLLFTANRSGAYADASAYGQGLMDLGAASSPVGGVAVPTGTTANGATAPVAGSAVQFTAGTLRALGMQGAVLVVDNYQRAPFWVPAQAFFREAAPRLLERQWASLRTTNDLPVTARRSVRFSHSPGLNNAVSADLASYRLGFANGAGGEAALGSHLELAWLPRLASPGMDSFAVGYAAELGGLRLGLLGTVPASQPAAERTLDASAVGSRKALGFVAQRAAGGTTYGVSFALAEDFEHPIGIATSGAFAVEDSAAASSGVFIRRSWGERGMLKASFELARHRAESSGALASPGYAVRSASVSARTALDARSSLSMEWKREWSGGNAARLDVPATIDETGAIGRVSYALPYDDLVGRTALTLRLDHRLARRIDLRTALTHERYGFGASATGIAAILEISD
jgi:hypothetical protein